MADAARTISCKFKALRSRLKDWSKHLSNLRLLISNCNSVICFMDALEDRRDLFNPEINLRAAVKTQLQVWLHYKNLYWKKRYTVNRIKLGDECTNFFHGMATISYRRNTISQLMNVKASGFKTMMEKQAYFDPHLKIAWAPRRHQLCSSIFPAFLSS